MWLETGITNRSRLWDCFIQLIPVVSRIYAPRFATLALVESVSWGLYAGSDIFISRPICGASLDVDMRRQQRFQAVRGFLLSKYYSIDTTRKHACDRWQIPKLFCYKIENTCARTLTENVRGTCMRREAYMRDTTVLALSLSLSLSL